MIQKFLKIAIFILVNRQLFCMEERQRPADKSAEQSREQDTIAKRPRSAKHERSLAVEGSKFLAPVLRRSRGAKRVSGRSITFRAVQTRLPDGGIMLEMPSHLLLQRATAAQSALPRIPAAAEKSAAAEKLLHTNSSNYAFDCKRVSNQLLAVGRIVQLSCMGHEAKILADARLLQTNLSSLKSSKHLDSVVCFSCDEASIACGLKNNKIGIESLVNKPYKEFAGHAEKITAILKADVLNLQGTTVSACANGEIKIWDAAGTCIHTYSEHRGPVKALCVIPKVSDDGIKFFASGSEDKSIKVWSHAGCVRTINVKASVECLAAYEHFLAAGLSDGSICVIDFSKGWYRTMNKEETEKILNIYLGSFPETDILILTFSTTKKIVVKGLHDFVTREIANTENFEAEHLFEIGSLNANIQAGEIIEALHVQPTTVPGTPAQVKFTVIYGTASGRIQQDLVTISKKDQTDTVMPK